MGGAVAMIAAVEIYTKLQYRAEHFITFGQPRVGNKGFVNYFNNVFPDSHRLKIKL